MNDRDGVSFPDIAWGADGTVHMIFTESDRSGDNLMYTCMNGGAWNTPVLVMAGAGGWYTAAVTAGNDGTGYIVFVKNDGTRGRLYYWNSSPVFGEPHEIITDTYTSFDATQPDVAVDGNQNIHIVFMTWTDLPGSNLYFCKSSNGEFGEIELIDSSLPYCNHNFPNITADSNNKTGVVFHKWDNVMSAARTYFASNLVGDFISPVEVSVLPTDTSDTRDAEVKMYNNAAYIVFSQNGWYGCHIGCDPGSNDIYFTKVNAATGEHIIPPVPVVLKVGWDNFGMGLIPAINGDPTEVHVAYFDYHEVEGRKSTYWRSRLRHLVVNGDNGTLLQPPETVYDEAAVGEPAMQVDDQGFAHIAFHSEGNPMYATNAVIPGGTMHIAGVEVTTQLAGNKVLANATVTIEDEDNTPVPDVTVSGVWSGLTSDGDAFVTGADGTGSASSDKVDKKASGTFTFTVTGVSRPGWTYDPDANVEDSGSAPWNLGKPAAQNAAVIPQYTGLLGNYPNPFNPVTTVRYQLAEAQHVKLRIYDIKGAVVSILAEGFQQPGVYEIPWHGIDAAGQPAASGVYFYTLDAGKQRFTNKMTLNR